MMKKRLLSLLLTLCMVMSLVPVTVLAAEGDIDITEVNINGVTGELWSHSDAPFASVDDGANYTVESQNWYSDIAGEIKPDSADRKPKAGEEYTFTITLKANDGYVFPIKSESRVFYDGSFKLNGAEYDAGAVTVSSDGKTLVATMFILTKAKGVVLQNASVTNEAELIWALTNPDVNVITMKNDIAVSATLIVDRAVTLDLYGYMLEISGSGSVIRVEDGGHLTLMDSDLTSTYYFNPEADGLWKWGTSGTKTVNGGVIYGGTGSRNGDVVSGSGVYVDDGGTFTMTGGNIVGCAVTIERVQAQGGGVYVAENGTFTMTGGSIAGCTAIAAQLSAYAMGGGICNEGTTTLSGTAEIRECRITHAGNLIGGGIYDSGVLNISGDVKITGCRAEGLETEALYTNIGGTIDGGTFDGSVWSHSTITGGTFNGEVINSNTITGGTFKGKVTNGGPISGGMFYGGITEGGVIRGCTVTYKNGDADYAMQVLQSSSAATRPIAPTGSSGKTFLGWYNGEEKYDFTQPVTENLTLTAKWAQDHIHCICGGANDVGDHSTHSDITWTAWTSTDSLPTAAGSYYLVNDVTLTYDLDTSFEWKVKENINLCLNGKTVSTNGTFASVEGSAIFSLTDCTDGGKVFGGSDYFEMEFIGFRGRLNAMRCSGASTFNLFGGAIIMNEAAKAGDNKLLNLNSGWDHPTFNIYEGRYLSAASNTTFNAYGGAIYGPTYLGLRTKCNFGNTAFARDVRHQKYYSQDFLGTVPTNFIGDAQMVWEYRLYILVGDTRIHIDDRNKNDILGDGTGSLKYEFDEDSQKNSSGVYDDDFGHGTLTFNNATLVYDADADCNVLDLGPFSLDIVLIGENAIIPDDGVGNNKTAIAGKRQMKIGGSGSLEIISKRDKCISIDYGVVLGNPVLMILTSENADGAGAVLTDVSDGGALSAAKYVKITPPHTHCVCGGTTDVGDHTTHAEDTVWQPWTATDSLPTKAGNYYLTNNVTLKSSQFIRADVKLCLCGKTITFESGRLYAWAWSFALSDCKGGGAIYGFDYSVVDVDGVFNMYGGSIVNNGTALENYCVSVGGDYRTFNLYGGVVGSDPNGFALIFMGDVDITAVFNAYGGTVEGLSLIHI